MKKKQLILKGYVTVGDLLGHTNAVESPIIFRLHNEWHEFVIVHPATLTVNMKERG